MTVETRSFLKEGMQKKKAFKRMPSGHYADHLKPLLCSYFRENERMRATAVSFSFLSNLKYKTGRREVHFKKRMEI